MSAPTPSRGAGRVTVSWRPLPLLALGFALCLSFFAQTGAAELHAEHLRCNARRNPLNIELPPRSAPPAPTPATSAFAVALSWQARHPTPETALGARQTGFRLLLEPGHLQALAPAADAVNASASPSSPAPLLLTPLQASAEPRYMLPAVVQLLPRTWYRWSVQLYDEDGRAGPWSAYAYFRTAPRRHDDWQGTAGWITPSPQAVDVDGSIMRGEFTLAERPVRAVLDACGLGQFEAYVNGVRAGDHQIDPGWTNYRKTCLFSSLDVSALLRTGDNALGVLLGNGMYNVPDTTRYTKFVGSMGPRTFVAQLTVTYGDGTVEVVAATGASWTAGTSPVTYSQTYGGEDFDARLWQAGWNEPGFDDSGWQPVHVWDGPGCRLLPAEAPPLKIIDTFPSVNVTNPKPNVYVYDLGRNFAGFPQIGVVGPAGASLQLAGGELLDKNTGLPSQGTSGAPQWYTYTLAGSGALEEWSPRFSLYGFRWVMVTVFPPPNTTSAPNVTISYVRGAIVYTSAPTAGNFHSSLPLFNRIHSIVLESMRANFLSVWADCPHREKLGWLEVSQLMAPGIIFNWDVQAYYHKTLLDMAEAQLPFTGMIPDIAPEYVVFSDGFRDSPEWGSAFALIPQFLRQYYNDDTQLSLYYRSIARYADYLESQASPNGMVAYGLGDWCDSNSDLGGCFPNGQFTPVGVTGTTTLYADYKALAGFATALQLPDEAAEWERRAANLSAAFLDVFWDPQAGVLGSGSQVSSAMPLFMGIFATAASNKNAASTSHASLSSPSSPSSSSAANEEAACTGTITAAHATYGGNCGAKDGNGSPYVNATCYGRDLCLYFVNTYEIGDPCQGTGKNYVVNYTCSSGSSSCNRTFSIGPEAGQHAARLDCTGLPVPVAPTADVVVEQLVRDVHQLNDHQTGGDVGHRFILAALRDNNRSDVVQNITLRVDYPSYGFILSTGATSLPEQWDGAGSQLHSMLGHVEEWFYTALAGIRLDLSRGCVPSAAAATSHRASPASSLGMGGISGVALEEPLSFQPHFAFPMQIAANYSSRCGFIAIEWERLEAASLQVAVTVPVGLQTASLLLPAGAESTLLRCSRGWLACAHAATISALLDVPAGAAVVVERFDGKAARVRLASGVHYLRLEKIPLN